MLFIISLSHYNRITTEDKVTEYIWNNGIKGTEMR